MSLRGHHHLTNSLVESASFLVVRLGGNYLALPAEGIRGVLTQEEAGNEEAVRAVGTRYELVDLARRLSVCADLSGPEMRMVLYSNRHSHGAIRVEEVVGLTDVARKNCLPLPAQFQRDERNWFGGFLVYQDHLVLIVNPSWMLGELAEVVSGALGRAEQIAVSASAAVGGSC